MLDCRHWVHDGVEGLAGVARGGPTPWHSHRHAVFGVVDSGRETIELRTGAVAIAPGTGFATPCDLAHRCAFADDTRYRIICVRADRRLAFRVLSSPSWRIAFDRAFEALRRAAAVDVDRLIDAATETAERVAPPSGSRPACVEKSLAEVDADLEDEKRLAALAERQGVSPFRLHRMFIRHVGLTPNQARICARVRASKRWLAEGARPTEVAYACGFADQSHLTRTFERFMGVSPGRYQRQLANAALGGEKAPLAAGADLGRG